MAHTRDIFLDHAATTPLHPEALGLMLPYFGNHFGTPSMPHAFGEKPRAALQEARARVSRLIGALPQEIFFTSSGTEANNLALLGAADARMGKGHIVTSSIEHSSVLNTLARLKHLGFEVTELAVDAQGLISPAQLEESIRDDTFLISIMHASNETGVIQPLETVGRIARERGVILHCDCVQSAGKVTVDVNSMQVDLLSISSHKLYGPKGTGALFVREGTRLSPVMFGSGQEKGLRPGTLNIPCIVGFGLACEKARLDMDKNSPYISNLKQSLEEMLIAKVPGIHINGSGAARVPHISSISFDSIQADALAAWLDLIGITVSARASLFSRRSSGPIAALGKSPDLASGTLRFSPGWENSMDEMHAAAEAVTEAVAGLRRFSRAVGDEPVCIMSFSSKNHVERSHRYLEEAGILCAVTARPVELDHLMGPRTALAVPCTHQDQAGSLLGRHSITLTGMHRMKGLCRTRSNEEQGFWEKVSQVKKDSSQN